MTVQLGLGTMAIVMCALSMALLPDTRPKELPKEYAKETDSRGRTVAESKAFPGRTVCGRTERRRPPGYGAL